MQSSQQSTATALRRSVIRRWPAVVLVVLIALAASIVAAASRSSSYQASAQILIVPLSQDNQIYFGTGLLRDAGDPGLTADSAAQVLHTEEIAKATATAVGHGVTPGSVLNRVEVRPSLETNVLAITASAGSRTEATQLATAYVDSVLAIRSQLVATDIKRRIAVLRARGVPATDEQLAALQATLDSGTDPTVQVAQTTSPAKAATATPAYVVVILALVGGLFIGILAALGIDRLSGRVRDEDDARRDTQLPVWGEIPGVPRGLRRHGPIAPSQLPLPAIKGFHTPAMHLGQASTEDGTIAVISAASGDGRTTTAVNLAVELARQGRSVALMLLADALSEPALKDLDSAGVKVVDSGAVPIAKSLEQAQALADLVVVDGPTVMGQADLVAALVPAQFVLVVRADHTGRQQLSATSEALRELGARPVGIVVLGARS
jgi:succinoglycan biosynthesis transport protein ExoP